MYFKPVEKMILWRDVPPSVFRHEINVSRFVSIVFLLVVSLFAPSLGYAQGPSVKQWAQWGTWIEAHLQDPTSLLYKSSWTPPPSSLQADPFFKGQLDWIQYEHTRLSSPLKHVLPYTKKLKLLTRSYISQLPPLPHQSLDPHSWMESTRSPLSQIGILSAQPYQTPTSFFFTFEVDRPQTLWLSVGYIGEIQAWFNRESLPPLPPHTRMWLDQEHWPIDLRKGKNTLWIYLSTPQSECVVRFKNKQGKAVQIPVASQPAWSNQIQPVEFEQGGQWSFQPSHHWTSLFKSFQKALKRSAGSTHLLSKAWIGLAYLARLQGIQEEALMPLIVSLDQVWNQNRFSKVQSKKTWLSALDALWALALITPSSLRLQLWNDYSLFGLLKHLQDVPQTALLPFDLSQLNQSKVDLENPSSRRLFLKSSSIHSSFHSSPILNTSKPKKAKKQKTKSRKKTNLIERLQILLYTYFNDLMVYDRLDQASQVLGLSLLLFPQDSYTVLAQAEWLNTVNLPQKAIHLLKSALLLHPENKQIKRALILALSQNQRFDEAFKIFQDWRASQKTSPSFLDQQTWFFFNLQKLHHQHQLSTSSHSSITFPPSLVKELIEFFKTTPNALSDLGYETLHAAYQFQDWDTFKALKRAFPTQENQAILELDLQRAFAQNQGLKAQRLLQHLLKINPDHHAYELNTLFQKGSQNPTSKVQSVNRAPLGPPLSQLWTEWHAFKSQKETSSLPHLQAPLIELYHHIDHDFDQQGRLLTRRRRVLLIQDPLQLKDAHIQEVYFVPQSQSLQVNQAHLVQIQPSLDSPKKMKIKKRSPLQESSRSLSQPQYRLYYETRAHQLIFPPLFKNAIIELEWTVKELQADFEKIRLHGSLNFLQGSVPRFKSQWTWSESCRKRLWMTGPIFPPFFPKTTSFLETLSISDPLSDNMSDQAAVQVDYKEHSSRSLFQSPRRPPARLSLGWTPPPLIEENRLQGSSLAPYISTSTLRKWKSVHDVFWMLIEPKLTPTPRLKALAKKWTQGISDPRKQIQALYHQITTRTRYVGLEFGKHSFEPAFPEETLDRGFGDCKDRAVLMIALARGLEIPLEFVMVRTQSAGRIRQDDVASLNRFNHALVYSPAFKMWIDPTVSHSDYDSVPLDDQGAVVLRVSPPSSKTSKNKDPVLEMIPFQPPSAHQSKWSFDFTQSPFTVLWTTQGHPATRLRLALEDQAQSALLNALHRFLPTADLVKTKIPSFALPHDPLEIRLWGTLKQSSLMQGLSSLLDMKFVPSFAPLPHRTLAKRMRPLAQKVCLRFRGKAKQLSQEDGGLKMKNQQIQSDWFDFKVNWTLETDSSSDKNSTSPHPRSSSLTTPYSLCISLSIKGGILPPKAYLNFRQDLLRVDHVFKPLLKEIGQMIE